MAPSNNFLEFGQLEELRNFLREDSCIIERFPCRFILVEGILNWQNILNYLKSEVNTTIKLSNYCISHDTIPNIQINQIADIINDEHNTKSLLFPLSELLRLGENFAAALIKNLAVFEAVGTKRCYIPLFQCHDHFKLIMSQLDRWNSGSLPPAWKLQGRRDELELILTPIDLKIKDDSHKVSGIKHYLNLWEKGSPKEKKILLATGLAQVSSDCSGEIEIKVYRDAFEIISKYLKETFSISKSWGTENQWQWLVKRVTIDDSFAQNAAKLLNVHQYDFWDIFATWSQLSNDQKWIFWLWSKIELPGQYLKCVLQNKQSFEDFKDDLINFIFNKNVSQDREILLERRRLLQYMNIKEMPQSFWRNYASLTEPLLKLKILTGITTEEKKEAILLIKLLFNEDFKVENILPYLENAYPELEYYLSPLPYQDEILNDYFANYKRARISDQAIDHLYNLADQAALSGYLFQFETRNGFLEKINRDSMAEIWIDGMGIEWLSYIYDYLRNYKHLEIDFSITRANLPSTTESNKNWPSHAILIRDLDNLAHSYDYEYPLSLVKQLDIIKQNIDNAVALLNNSSQLVITSDHGMTRYAFHRDFCKKAPEGAEIHKWGRCAKVNLINDEIASSHEWIVEGKNICLTRHGRFQGGAGAIGEVHGGATLEEVLVPVIIIRRQPRRLDQKFNFIVENHIVRLDIKGSGTLTDVRINPDPTELHLRTWDNRLISGKRVGAGKYEFSMTGLKVGEFKVRFETGIITIGEIILKIESAAMVEEDMGI